MRYQIEHTTHYVYETPVSLLPHVVRLQPRSDVAQTLHSFTLAIAPTPQQQSPMIELDGNTITKVWFHPTPTESLTIHTVSLVETHRTNPFDYLLESWAIQLPIDYPTSLLMQLKPYLTGQQPGYSDAIDPVAAQLAQEICHQVEGNPTRFLSELTSQIYKTCQYVIREIGSPLPPGITWTQQLGTCRDFAVLFMETCRAIGLAARFVSGYEEGDPNNPESHLHAWVEVYLPGAGWRGFDPTHGLAVSDRHIALVASPHARHTAPITGSFQPGSTHPLMTHQLQIQHLN
jgi:transglutaminase-like putative cysteine protease